MEKYLQYWNEKKSEKNVEVVSEFDEKILEGIIDLENKALPDGWQYEDAKNYYREVIENPENINVILRKNNDIIGYCLAKPHDVVFEEIREEDKYMDNDNQCYYLETVEIMPENRKGLGSGAALVGMFDALVKELKKRNIQKMSLHARIKNNFHNVIRKIFGDNNIIETRRIENWKYYNNGEPTEYLKLRIDNM